MTYSEQVSRSAGPTSPVDRLILAALRRNGPRTRSEITALAGLSKSTVTEHVQLLLRRGLVVERPQPLAGQRGRPATLIDLAQGSGVTVALVLSHSDRLVEGPVQCALVGADGSCTSFRRLPAGERALGRGVHELELMLDEAGVPRTAVRSAVLGLPLPLDLSDSGAIAVHPLNRVIAGLEHVVGARPQDAMTRAFGVPARLGNDADLAVVGEAVFGAGAEVADLVFLKCLAGGGAGLIRGGQLLTGGRVTAGETEHIQVARGLPCVCGAPRCRGGGEPLELWARLHRWGTARPSSLPDLLERCAAHDRATLTALQRLGHAFGRGLANLHLIFQPTLIVLEAGLEEAYAPLASGLAKGVMLDAPPWAQMPVRIARAEGKPSPEVCGAARMGGIVMRRTLPAR